MWMGRVFRTLGGLAAGLTVYIAMPAGFAVFGHNPITALRHAARTSFMHDDGSLLLAVGTVAGWGFWAYSAVGFLIAIAGKVTGRSLRLPGFGPAQALAALVLATVTTTTIAPALTSARTATTVTVHMPVRGDSTPEATDGPQIEAASPQTTAEAPAALHAGDEYVSHVVQRNETLIGLAERYYGDSNATGRISEANIGLPQPDGRSLQTGQIRIYPGWTLRIPTPAHAASHNATAVTAPAAAAAHSLAATAIYETRKGDYLWFIAERFLGDPERFADIAACNPDLITNPDLIQPGWQLTLPDGARDSGPRPHATGELIAPHPPAQPQAPQPSPPAPATMPDPTATPGTTISPSGQTTAPAAPSAQGRSPAGDHPGHDGVDDEHNLPHATTDHLQLPSGGWITASMVTALALALVVARLQRRRRATKQWPIQITHNPAEPRLSASMNAIATAGLSILPPPAENSIQAPPTPTPIALDSGDRELSLHRDLLGITALAGPGAEAAARAIIATALTSSLRQWGAGRAELHIDSTTLQQLLDGRGLAGGVARLGISNDPAAAVSFLEQEAIFRAQVLADHDAEDLDELHADPDNDKLGLFVLITPADETTHARLAAVAAQAQQLRIAIIILGETTEVPAIAIAADGTIAPDPSRPELSGRIATLAASDLHDALTLLAEATDPPFAIHTLPAEPATTTDDEQAEQPNPLVASTEPGTDSPADTNTEPLPAEQLAPPRDHSPHVRLSVLGIPSLCPPGWDQTPPGIRGRTLPILCFLATRPRGATLKEILAALQPESIDWPDDDDRRDKDDDRPEDDRRRKANATIQSTITTMRTILRQIDGGHHMYIRQKQRVYYIDPQAVEVDLWRMQAHISQANQATNEGDALAALHAAVACYGGDFAGNNEQNWIGAQRTTYRTQYLNALSRIAEIQETEHPDAALAALEQAIEAEEVNEETYQTIMRIQGRIGRTDAVTRTMSLLRDRLQAKLESDPRPETERIYERMLRPPTSLPAR